MEKHTDHKRTNVKITRPQAAIQGTVLAEEGLSVARHTMEAWPALPPIFPSRVFCDERKESKTGSVDFVMPEGRCFSRGIVRTPCRFAESLIHNGTCFRPGLESGSGGLGFTRRYFDEVGRSPPAKTHIGG